MTPEQKFFEALLEETKKQYEQSTIANRSEGKWFYSVCATPIRQGKPVVFGINWGGDKDSKPQTEMPDGSDIGTYPFVKSCEPYLKQYFNIDVSNPDFNYTNLCFFRTPNAKLLRSDDYKSSISLFIKYVDFINPPFLLSIGTSNFDVLNKNDLLTDVKTTNVVDSSMQGLAADFGRRKCYFVPHPQARLSADNRNAIWSQVKSLLS